MINNANLFTTACFYSLGMSAVRSALNGISDVEWIDSIKMLEDLRKSLFGKLFFEWMIGHSKC